MARNGRRAPRRPRVGPPSPAASPEEAAAIAAALERFLIETTLASAPADTSSRWQRAALREGVESRRELGGGWGRAPSGQTG